MNGKALLAALMAILMLPGPAMAQSTAASSGDAQSGTDTVTFYGHVFRVSQDDPNPANTEFPFGEESYGIGLGVNCASAAQGQALNTCQNEDGNKMAMFSTAGPVDVKNAAEFEQEGAYGQLHNERGQTKDILLDTSKEIETTVFGTWDSHGWPVRVGNPYDTDCVGPHPNNVPCMYPYWGWDPGAYENVVMEATLYHADLGDRTNSSQAPPVDEAIDSGDATVVAHGQWGPGQVMNGVPGADNAFQWDINLGAPQVDTIPQEDDFFLVYDTFQSTGEANACVRCPMRWWSGEFFPPSFTLPVENAFTVERVIPNFANGQLAMLGILNTPWGSYDVDTDSVDLSIEGPNGAVEPDTLQQYSDFSVAHGGHFEPVNTTWIWDYNKDDVPAGEYEITVSAENFQNSAKASCTATFTLESGENRLRPGSADPGICGTQSEGTDEKAEELKEDVNSTDG
jgi:hypothetical protein